MLWNLWIPSWILCSWQRHEWGDQCQQAWDRTEKAPCSVKWKRQSHQQPTLGTHWHLSWITSSNWPQKWDRFAWLFILQQRRCKFHLHSINVRNAGKVNHWGDTPFLVLPGIACLKQIQDENMDPLSCLVIPCDHEEADCLDSRLSILTKSHLI